MRGGFAEARRALEQVERLTRFAAGPGAGWRPPYSKASVDYPCRTGVRWAIARLNGIADLVITAGGAGALTNRKTATV
jgi:hypothetical protein